MSDPHMTLDCPRCGESIIDTNPFDFAANMTPEEFGVNMRRLIDAHDDACTPRKVKPDAINAKLRRRWWFFEVGVVVMWALFSVFNYIANGFSAGMAWTTGAVVLGLKVFEKITVFRSGYMRGRAETMVRMPMLAPINIHPADRWRHPAHWDDDDAEVTS